MLEELVVDVEGHLVVPGGVGVAAVVDPGGEFVVRVHVRHRERAEHLGHRREVLRRDYFDFEELQGTLHRHGLMTWPEDGGEEVVLRGRPWGRQSRRIVRDECMKNGFLALENGG